MDALYDVIKSKKHRTWQNKIHEPILFKYLELCVDLRRSHIAKEGLYQYKLICQQVNIVSLEDVIRYFLKLAEDRADAARQESRDQVPIVDDLDQIQTPERYWTTLHILHSYRAKKKLNSSLSLDKRLSKCSVPFASAQTNENEELLAQQENLLLVPDDQTVLLSSPEFKNGTWIINFLKTVQLLSLLLFQRITQFRQWRGHSRSY